MVVGRSARRRAVEFDLELPRCWTIGLSWICPRCNRAGDSLGNRASARRIGRPQPVGGRTRRPTPLEHSHCALMIRPANGAGWPCCASREPQPGLGAESTSRRSGGSTLSISRWSNWRSRSTPACNLWGEIRRAASGLGECPAKPHGGVSRLVLELPEVVRGASRVLRLTAMAPLRLGESTMLPRIEAKGVAWQDGTLSVLLPDPFQLEQLVAFSCRQSKTGPLPAALSAKARIAMLRTRCDGKKILVARQAKPLSCRRHRSCGWVLARKPSRRRPAVESGERFSRPRTCPTQWIIESVTTTPEEAAGRLESTRRRKTAAGCSTCGSPGANAKPSVAHHGQARGRNHRPSASD